MQKHDKKERDGMVFVGYEKVLVDIHILGASCYLNLMFSWKPEMVKNKTFFKWSQDMDSSF